MSSQLDEKAVTNAANQDADHEVGEVTDRRRSLVSKLGDAVNASGHRDQLQRQYGLLSICG